MYHIFQMLYCTNSSNVYPSHTFTVHVLIVHVCVYYVCIDETMDYVGLNYYIPEIIRIIECIPRSHGSNGTVVCQHYPSTVLF